MTRADIIRIHNAIDRDDPNSFIPAANMVIAHSGKTVGSINAAVTILRVLLTHLLDTENYTDAALLCWGTELFDPRPRSVRMIWKSLMSKSKILVMGAGSLGKSYTAIVWALLSWVRDPEYTAIKLVSTTAGHAKANTFSTLVRFHNESKIPLPGSAQSGFIGLNADDKHSAITLVAIPTGDDGKGRLQGFHPLPRRKAHPRFGAMSRVILIIDEAEDAPGGLWQGVNNMLGNETMSGSVTVYAATNPKRKESIFAQKAEPEDGWSSVNIETTESWQSAQGWYVIRLDGAKCENVIEKRQVYEGLLTYQGYQNFLRLGPNHPDYYTFARGWYPETSVAYNIIAPYVTNEIRGTYLFSRVIANCASLDPAFEEGGDDAILTTGRYGLAIGFTSFNTNQFIDFRDKPRYVLQAEQQFPITKGKTIEMADDVIKTLRMLKVTPEWFAIDKTGNSRGLYDVINSKFPGILGIEWGEGATDKKILEEDSDPACDKYQGVVTEMLFALSAWAEYGYVKLASIMPTSPLFTEMIGRQYKRVSKTKQQAESKADFKARNGGKSPDRLDSLIMMIHLVRMRADVNAAALPENQTEPRVVRPIGEEEDVWMRFGEGKNEHNPHAVKFVPVK